MVLTLVALLLLGGGSIDVLLITLLLGIIAGTYSSIFIASQILVAWEDGDFARLWRRVTPKRLQPAAEPSWLRLEPLRPVSPELHAKQP